MPVPTATRENIEQNEPIDILVRVESETTAHGPVEQQYVVTDRDGARFGLAIFERQAAYTLESDRWYVLENASGNVYNGKPELRSNFGSMSVKAVAEPPDSVTVPGSTSSDTTVHEGGVLAFDIETISTVPETALDLGDSSHLELLCIGVGYRPSSGVPVESDVLFRRDLSPESEQDLLERFCDWIDARDPSLLVTYNGTGFDLPHLRGRAAAISDVTTNDDATDTESPDTNTDNTESTHTSPTDSGSSESNSDGSKSTDTRLAAVLDMTTHEDLYVSGPLENATAVATTHWDAYAHDMDPTRWRQEQRELGRYPANRPLDEPVVVAGDVPYFGRRYLELRSDDPDTGGKRAHEKEQRALRRLLREYAVADVEPLFELC